MDAAGSRHSSIVEQQGNVGAGLNEDEMGNKTSRTMLHSEGTRTDGAEAASAFQRWKQYHLQRTFNQELKRVAESSLKDEASLATMERERAQREKELAYALADSASLRAQLTAKEEEIHALRSQTSAEEPESSPVGFPAHAAPVELEEHPRSVEDLVWVNEPRVQPQKQEHRFSGVEHHLRELVAAIRRLDPGSGVETAFLAQVREAIRQVEQDLDHKVQARLQRQGGRPLESQESDYCRKWDSRTHYDGHQAHAADLRRRKRPMREWHVIKQDGHNPDCKPLHHENVSKSVVWKWRWALAVSKSKTLSRHLKHLKALYKSQLTRNGSGNVEDSEPSREVGKLKLLMLKELATIMPSYSLVSFVISLWRAYSCCSRTEKGLLSRLMPVDKLMASFPLWVEKVGERQLLLYFFSLWQMVASRDRQEHQQRASAAGRWSPTNRRRAIRQETVPSIYEPFHHCCYPSSPTNESPRCSSPRRTVKTRPKRHQQDPMRSHRDERCVGEAEAEVEIVKSLPNSARNHNNNNKPADHEYGNVAAASAVGILDATPSPPMSAPAQQEAPSFSAQALRRLELQLQHDLQDMQPILARATKAIQDQIRVDQHGRSFHDPRRATSTMSTLWKICTAVEYALTEARNQMLCIIHDSARCECEDPANQQLQQQLHMPAEVSSQQQLHMPAEFSGPQQPVVLRDEKRPRPLSGGFQSVFHLISRTSGVRRKSCLAAQYAAELNQKLQTNRFRNWL